LDGGSWSLVGWWLAAVVGTGLAAFAVRSSSIPAVLRSAAVPTAVGAGAMALGLGGIHLVTGAPVDVLALVGTVAKYLAVYLPSTFRPRGGHLPRRPRQPRAPIGRATRSSLRGTGIGPVGTVAHLPAAGGLPGPLLVLELIAWHTLVGVPLSWRGVAAATWGVPLSRMP
jgi:hypothetical protein